MPRRGIAKSVYKITKNALPYDKRREEIFDVELRRVNYDSAYLGSYINNRAGVCREQALLAGYLLERLKDEGIISGTIHINRNMKNKSGHEWVRWETPDGKVTIIDPAQRFVGSIENAKKLPNGYWKKYEVDMRKKDLSVGTNSLEGDTGINTASSFGDLYSRLINGGGIEGSLQHYSPGQLIRIIDDVRAGRIPLAKITSANGLRAKVQELLADS